MSHFHWKVNNSTFFIYQCVTVISTLSNQNKLVVIGEKLVSIRHGDWAGRLLLRQSVKER